MKCFWFEQGNDLIIVLSWIEENEGRRIRKKGFRYHTKLFNRQSKKDNLNLLPLVLPIKSGLGD